jgi:excisionase family DNA binding protein
MNAAKIVEQSRASQAGIGSDGSSDQSESWLRRDERVNTRDAAQYLGISESTVRKFLMRRLLPHYKLGKVVRFSINDLDAWLASKHVEAVKGDRR